MTNPPDSLEFNISKGKDVSFRKYLYIILLGRRELHFRLLKLNDFYPRNNNLIQITQIISIPESPINPRKPQRIRNLGSRSFHSRGPSNTLQYASITLPLNPSNVASLAADRDGVHAPESKTILAVFCEYRGHAIHARYSRYAQESRSTGERRRRHFFEKC